MNHTAVREVNKTWRKSRLGRRGRAHQPAVLSRSSHDRHSCKQQPMSDWDHFAEDAVPVDFDFGDFGARKRSDSEVSSSDSYDSEASSSESAHEERAEICSSVADLLSHPSEGVRRTAVEALGRLPAGEWHADVVSTLVAQTQQPEDPALALTSILALGRLPPRAFEGHTAAIMELLFNGDPTLRQTSVAVLGMLEPQVLAENATRLIEAVSKLGESEHDFNSDSSLGLPRLLLRLPTGALLPRLASVIELLAHE